MPILPIILLLTLFLPLVGRANTAPITQAPMTASQVCRAAVAIAEREAGLPHRLLFAISRVESGRRDPASGSTDPWPWTINAEGRGSFFPSKEEAIAAVRQLQAQGVRSIDVGCMQVNLRHHPNAFPSLEAAFDPLTNARYGARFLAELNPNRGDWMVAAGHYHSQTPEHATRYRALVAAAWDQERQGPGATAFAGLMGFGAGGGGPMMLSNRQEQARIIPLAAGAAGGGGAGNGRGLDAYRERPIPMAGRMFTR